MKTVLACVGICISLLSTRAMADCRASRIEVVSTSLAEGLVESLQVRLDRTAPILTAPFADLHELKKTSSLGRILAEEIGSTFSRYGYRIADQRLFVPTPFTRKEHGESVFSSEPEQYGSTSGVQAILTGTYALADGGVRVFARLVQVSDKTVLASASCQLRITAEVQTLLTASAPQSHPTAAPSTLLSLKSKANVKKVQNALRAQGLYAGALDGVWGKKSKAALARFRGSMALPATSEWDLTTQNALLPKS